MNMPNIKKNYFYRLLYDLLVLATPFVTTPYVSRVLGADGIGIYSYTSSLMAYFTLFATLGTASYGAREIACHRDSKQQSSKLFWEIELMTVGTTLLCLLGWILVIIFSREYTYYFIALIPLLLATAADITWYFTGFEQVKYIVVRGAFCKIVGIVCLFLFVRQKSDLLVYIVLNSVIQLVGNLSMWTYLPRMLAKVDFRTLTFKKHFHETLIYFIPTIASSIYTVLDKTLIGIITDSSSQNGYYEQATKVVNMLKTVVFTSVNSVTEARLSYLFAEKKEDEIHYRIERSMDFILLAGFGCMFGLAGTASRFAPLFFGTGYEPVAGMLHLMAPLIVIIGISSCLGSQYYTPSGRRKQSSRYIIIGAVLNLCLNLLLIPRFSAMGAIGASIISELAITVLYVLFCNGYMSFLLLWKLIWKRLGAGILMCGVVQLIGQIQGTEVVVLTVQVVAGAITYGIILLALRDGMLLELIKMGIKLMKKTVGGIGDGRFKD